MGFCVTGGSLPPCRAWLRVLATAPPGPAVRVRRKVRASVRVRVRASVRVRIGVRVRVRVRV